MNENKNEKKKKFFYALLPIYIKIKFQLWNKYFDTTTGEPGSHVFGSIINGVFEGSIHSPVDSFYVEKAHKYFPKESNQSFHSIIYNGKDVDDSFFGGCGVTDDVIQWMEKVQVFYKRPKKFYLENNLKYKILTHY